MRAPKLEGFSDLFRITVPLINSGNAAESSAAVVQRQFDDMRSYTKSLQSTGEAPAQVVKRPWADRWRDLVFSAAMIAKRTIRTIQHKHASGGQGV